MAYQERIEKPHTRQTSEQQQVVYDELQRQADAQDTMRERAAIHLGVLSAELADGIAYVEHVLDACDLNAKARAA